MLKEIYLMLTLAMPPIVLFFMLLLTKDAILSMVTQIFMCYLLPCWIYDTCLGNFKWNWFVGKETIDLWTKVGKCITLPLI